MSDWARLLCPATRLPYNPVLCTQIYKNHLWFEISRSVVGLSLLWLNTETSNWWLERLGWSHSLREFRPRPLDPFPLARGEGETWLRLCVPEGAYFIVSRKLGRGGGGVAGRDRLHLSRSGPLAPPPATPTSNPYHFPIMLSYCKPKEERNQWLGLRILLNPSADNQVPRAYEIVTSSIWCGKNYTLCSSISFSMWEA